MSNAAPKLKLVRAKRTGFYDGHRRRAGAEFVVAADAKESWFEVVGPAPKGAVLPSQIQNSQAPVRKSFTQVMQELGDPQAPPKVPTPMTLAEASAFVAPPNGGELV